MTFPDYLLLAVVLLVGVPASFRNATAAALVVSYLVSEAVYFILGDSFQLRFYILVDLTVIAVMACKSAARPFRNPARFLDMFWYERSFWDRIVLVVFVPVWASYFLLTGDIRWWALYYLALAQFVAAGAEGLQSYITACSAKTGAAPDSSAGSKFDAGWRERGYG